MIAFFDHKRQAQRLADRNVNTVPEQEADAIRIEQLEVLGRVGVPDEERAQPQKLVFTFVLIPLRSFADLNDDIRRAVNYAAVCDEVKAFVGQRRDKLIETLADAIASHLLERFEIRRVTVELRKYILPDTEFVSVTVTRDRSKG